MILKIHRGWESERKIDKRETQQTATYRARNNRNRIKFALAFTDRMKI
jgi:hypothetical protein